MSTSLSTLMRRAHYSARDHYRGLPYITLGTRFFARLARNLVELADQQWMWDEQLARRWHERRQLIIGHLVRGHMRQSFTENAELPEMISVDNMMGWFRSWESSGINNSCDSLHTRWTYNRITNTAMRKGLL